MVFLINKELILMKKKEPIAESIAPEKVGSRVCLAMVIN